MSARVPSLRARLFVTILLALVLTAVCASAVRFTLAKRMSNRLYDSTLEVVALTISRDVILTEGDLLAEDLLNRLVSALGDPVYYRVIGPSGAFVTGYSGGPEGSPARDETLPRGKTVFYDGTYFGEPVRGAVLSEFVSDTRFGGWATVEVWQTVSERRDLSLVLLGQTIVLLVVVICIAALAISFSINVGLRPLADLSQAVARRGPRDLVPIERALPREIEPLGTALNGLIAEVALAMERRDAFISDASHQLRNPIAALGALIADAARAETEPERRAILAEAEIEMSRVCRMTSQLLSLERLDAGAGDAARAADMVAAVSESTARAAPRVLALDAELDFDAPPGPLVVHERSGLLVEAVENLLDNACLYGVRPGGRLRVALAAEESAVVLTVADDGPGVPEAARARIFGRFQRGAEDGGRGSGLGLAIARRIAESHGGRLDLVPSAQGACFVLRVPRAA